MWNTLSVQESAREIVSVAFSVEQERHTECGSHCLKAMFHIHVEAPMVTEVTLLSANEFILFRFQTKQVIVLLFSSYNNLLRFEPKNKLIGRM